MRVLVGKCRLNTTEWRIVSNTGTNEYEVWENDRLSKHTSLRAASTHVRNRYLTALDLRPFQPGQQVQIPMADGSQKNMTVLQNNQDAATLTDNDSGQQMMVPHFMEGGAASLTPVPAQDATNDSTDESGTNTGKGVQMISPGTGIKVSMKNTRRVKMPVKAAVPGMTPNTGPDNVGLKGYEPRAAALSMKDISASDAILPNVPNAVLKAWADAHDLESEFYSNSEDVERAAKMYQAIKRFLELANSQYGASSSYINTAERAWSRYMEDIKKGDSYRSSMSPGMFLIDELDTQLNGAHEAVLQATRTERPDWYRARRLVKGYNPEKEELSKRRGPGEVFLTDLWEEQKRLETTGVRKVRVAYDNIRTPYHCKMDGTYLERDNHRPRKVCPQCGMLYTSQVYPPLASGDVSIRLADLVREETSFRLIAQPAMPPAAPTPAAPPSAEPETNVQPGSNPTQGRVLSRHEIVDRAEQIILDAIYKGITPGVSEIVEHMSSVYGNSPDELYSGVKFAWEKVQYEEQGDYNQKELEKTHDNDELPVTPKELEDAPMFARV